MRIEICEKERRGKKRRGKKRREERREREREKVVIFFVFHSSPLSLS